MGLNNKGDTLPRLRLIEGEGDPQINQDREKAISDAYKEVRETRASISEFTGSVIDLLIQEDILDLSDVISEDQIKTSEGIMTLREYVAYCLTKKPDIKQL